MTDAPGAGAADEPRPSLAVLLRILGYLRRYFGSTLVSLLLSSDDGQTRITNIRKP